MSNDGDARAFDELVGLTVQEVEHDEHAGIPHHVLTMGKDGEPRGEISVVSMAWVLQNCRKAAGGNFW